MQFVQAGQGTGTGSGAASITPASSSSSASSGAHQSSSSSSASSVAPTPSTAAQQPAGSSTSAATYGGHGQGQGQGHASSSSQHHASGFPAAFGGATAAASGLGGLGQATATIGDLTTARLSIWVGKLPPTDVVPAEAVEAAIRRAVRPGRFGLLGWERAGQAISGAGTGARPTGAAHGGRAPLKGFGFATVEGALAAARLCSLDGLKLWEAEESNQGLGAGNRSHEGESWSGGIVVKLGKEAEAVMQAWTQQRAQEAREARRRARREAASKAREQAEQAESKEGKGEDGEQEL